MVKASSNDKRSGKRRVENFAHFRHLNGTGLSPQKHKRARVKLVPTNIGFASKRLCPN
jgi:hypothetical protein